MRKNVVVLVLLGLVIGAAGAFAHGGKSHHLMGTVKSLDENHLTVTATDGHEVTVELTPETKYEKGGKPASRSDLEEGVRVSIQLTEDDKNALKVKIGDSEDH